MSALAAVHQAIYDRLNGSGFAVYDEPPPDTASPAEYVVIGDGTETPWDTMDRRGSDATETVHVWTRGNSSLRSRTVAQNVAVALEGAPLPVAGNLTVRLRQEFAATLKEPGWRHVPIRFRIITVRAA